MTLSPQHRQDSRLRVIYRAAPKPPKPRWYTRLLMTYGLDRAEVDAMVVASGGLCALCPTQLVRPFINSNRATGVVRLLCEDCSPYPQRRRGVLVSTAKTPPANRQGPGVQLTY